MQTTFQKPVRVIALQIIAVCSSQFAAVAGISSLITAPLLLEVLAAPPDPGTTGTPINGFIAALLFILPPTTPDFLPS